MSARDIASLVRSGERSAVEVTREALARVDERDASLSAFVHVDGEGALERAAALDARRARGEDPGPLAGVPLALKANLCLEGAPVDCASQVLAGWSAPYTASAVQRLLDAGAIPLGLANMDEFGMGSSTEHSCHGVTRHPVDPSRTPGGSSGGSAAAVAAGLVPIALGSDTGGSARQPAALCGVCAWKPTYGRVSRYGLVAFASSLDQVSPIAGDCEDLSLVASLLSEPDERDATHVDLPALEPVPRRMRLDGLAVGVIEEALGEGVDDDVRERIERAAERLAQAGCRVERVALPSLRQALATYYVVATAEASSNLARYDGMRYGPRSDGDGSLAGAIAAGRSAGFGAEVRRRVLLGTFVASEGHRQAWYEHALRVRRRIADELAHAFTEVELLLGPTSPGPAFPLGERVGDPLAMYASDLCTVPQSLAGLPAVSVPCGSVTREGVELPVGLQLTAPPFADALALAVAREWEALA